MWLEIFYLISVELDIKYLLELFLLSYYIYILRLSLMSIHVRILDTWSSGIYQKIWIITVLKVFVVDPLWYRIIWTKIIDIPCVQTIVTIPLSILKLNHSLQEGYRLANMWTTCYGSLMHTLNYLLLLFREWEKSNTSPFDDQWLTHSI